jgi:hypothetical protein
MRIFSDSRRLMKIFLNVSVLWLGMSSASVFAAEAILPVARNMNSLIGEKLEYDISFLWFDLLAEACLTFNKGRKGGTFIAVLEAKTLGVAAWLTNYQRQKYVATMELDEQGKLRTVEYHSPKIKGKGENGRAPMDQEL